MSFFYFRRKDVPDGAQSSNMKKYELEILNELEDSETCYEVWDKENRIVFIGKDINNTLVDLTSQFIEWEREDFNHKWEEYKPIKILINSLGGDVMAARSLVDIIEAISIPVYTVNIGNCYSAALYLYAAGDVRYSIPMGSFLIHDGYWFGEGTTEKVRSSFKFSDELDQAMTMKLLKSSNFTFKDVDQKGVRDWYFTTEEAIQYGLVDHVLFRLKDII